MLRLCKKGIIELEIINRGPKGGIGMCINKKKLFKGVGVFFTSVILFLGGISSDLIVAQDELPSEVGNKTNVVELNKSYKIRDFKRGYESNNVKFSVTKPGRIKISVKDCTTTNFEPGDSLRGTWSLELSGSSILTTYWDKYTSETAETEWITINPGEYEFKQWRWEVEAGVLDFGSANPEANLTILYEEAGSYVGESEKNDTYDTANVLSAGSTIEGNCSHSNDKDLYKFVMENPGKVSLVVDGKMDRTQQSVLMEDEKLNVTHLFYLWDQTTTFRLPKGVYYVQIDAIGDYTVSLNVTYENNAEAEFNDVSSNAMLMENNVSYTGSFNPKESSNYDDIDFYKFVVNEYSDITIKYTVPRQATVSTELCLMNKELKELQKDSSGSNPYLEINDITLDPGTYYIRLTGNYSLGGDYSICVNWAQHMELNCNKVKKKMGQTIQLTVDNLTDDISWSSLDENIAIVDEDGAVTIVGVGKTKIVGKIGTDKEVSCSIEGVSNFSKGVWSDKRVSYNITKIFRKNLYATVKRKGEKYKLTFKLNSKGNSATVSFRCKYGKKHKITISCKGTKKTISGKEITSCKKKLW